MKHEHPNKALVEPLQATFREIVENIKDGWESTTKQERFFAALSFVSMLFIIVFLSLITISAMASKTSGSKQIRDFFESKEIKSMQDIAYGNLHLPVPLGVALVDQARSLSPSSAPSAPYRYEPTTTPIKLRRFKAPSDLPSRAPTRQVSDLPSTGPSANPKSEFPAIVSPQKIFLDENG
jgi:hypothetical protein